MIYGTGYRFDWRSAVLLSEKELERLILDNTFVGRVASFTEEHPDGEPAVRGAGAAAHAIAEKLAEGVVVEARGVIRTTHEGHYALTIEHTYQGSGIGWATNAGSDVLDILRGDDDYESVTVTVTKEEGDGQGVD